MKKEYELLEKFRTDQVTVQPSLQKPKKSSFKEWTFLEIVGCIFSISLIVYGSYNMIFPPTESESAVQQVEWVENPSKQTKLVSSDQRYKDNYELDQEINRNLIESSSSDKGDQENPLKKLVLASAEANELNQPNIVAQAGGAETQGTASSSGTTSTSISTGSISTGSTAARSTNTSSTSSTSTSTQRASTQSNTTASTAQRSSTASSQSNSTTSSQRSSTASTQTSSSRSSSQSTQSSRSSTTTA